MNQSFIVACPACNQLNRVPEQKLSAGGKCGSCKNSLFHARPVELDQVAFQNHVIKSDLPTLVDFWAPWCGPCKMMTPVFAEAAIKLEPGIRIAKVNTEVEQMLAARYNIRSIPTLILFRQGQEINRISGALNLAQLLQWTNQSMSNL